MSSVGTIATAGAAAVLAVLEAVMAPLAAPAPVAPAAPAEHKDRLYSPSLSYTKGSCHAVAVLSLLPRQLEPADFVVSATVLASGGDGIEVG